VICLAEAHLSLLPTGAGLMILVALGVWYWRQLSRGSVPAFRRRLRRIGLVIGGAVAVSGCLALSVFPRINRLRIWRPGERWQCYWCRRSRWRWWTSSSRSRCTSEALIDGSLAMPCGSVARSSNRTMRHGIRNPNDPSDASGPATLMRDGVGPLGPFPFRLLAPRVFR
jgi:hypothetical protein